MRRRQKFVKDPNWTPPPNLPEDKYSVAIIEGTGTKAAYTRLSDKLVRSSRIFWHLCEKIHEAKRLTGYWKMWAVKYKERVKEVKIAFKEFEKDADAILKAEMKKNERLLKKLEWYKQTVRRMDFAKRGIKQQRTKVAKNNQKLRQQMSPLKKNITFLTKELRWNNTRNKTDDDRVELMLRGVFGFQKLQYDGEITFEDFIYLSVGHQLDAFNKTHIRNRFGAELTRYFTRDMKVLIDKGYIRRFERREMYYVTDDGKKFYSEKMRKIFARKSFLYWKGIIENIK